MANRYIEIFKKEILYPHQLDVVLECVCVCSLGLTAFNELKLTGS